VGADPANSSAAAGWGAQLRGQFDDRVVLTSHAGGPLDPLAGATAERWQQVLEQRPDWVFLQVGGAADSAAGSSGGDPGPWQGALRGLLTAARSAKIRPVLITTPEAWEAVPQGDQQESGRGEGGRGEGLATVANAVRQVARELRVPVIDLHADSRDLARRLTGAGPQGEWFRGGPPERLNRRIQRAHAALVAQALPGRVPGLITRLEARALRAGLPLGGTGCGLPRLLLPRRLHAVVGTELNLYFDNAVLVPEGAGLEFDVQCAQGVQQADRWTWTPAPEVVGEVPLELIVRDFTGEIVARGQTTIEVAPTAAGSGRDVSLLLIGDSLTHASLWPARLLERSQGAAQPRLTLLGSHQPPTAAAGVRHEGYGGWTAQRFATNFVEEPPPEEVQRRGSPFLVRGADGQPVLDFAAYLRRIDAPAPPDVVAIFLGPNDIFGLTGTNLEEGLEVMLGHLKSLIEMVGRSAPRTKVALLVALPPAASQDAFGANYKSGQTRWQYRRNQHRLAEWLHQLYDDPQAPEVELVATHLQIDCRHAYPTVEAPWHADSTLRGIRQNNGVHPDANGYRQVGDAFHAWLMCHLWRTRAL